MSFRIQQANFVDIYIPFWIYSNRECTSSVNCLNNIYIPFWIYSNYSLIFCSLLYVIFTFHSGYIPIFIRDSHSVKNRGFTFHSGYIPIASQLFAKFCSLSFTFHSGYIPIRLLSYHLFTPFKTLFFVYLDFFYRQSMVFL